MSFPKKAVVAVDVSDINPLKSLHKLDLLDETEIHLVHVVRPIFYTDYLSVPVVFPVGEEQVKVSQNIIEFMKASHKDIVPYSHRATVVYKCLFDVDTKAKFCEYAKTNNADLVVVGTRDSRGIFESSFANYLCRHSPTNLFIVRPEHEKN